MADHRQTLDTHQLARTRSAVALDLWACGLFAIAALSACASTYLRPLWFDEIFTATVAQLGSPTRIWEALTHAADANPPLYYILGAYGLRLPLSEEVSLRLPSLIGFLAFAGSVPIFVRRAFGPLSCLVATAFLVSSETLRYGSEARPYGALLGAFGLAALLWQQRKLGGASRTTLVLLILCLTLACSLHYYGVLGVMMFGLAEVFVGIRRRKLDWPFLLSLPLALIPLLIARPLIQAARSEFGAAFVAHASPRSIVAAYLFTFSSPQLPTFIWARLQSGREMGLSDVGLPAILILAACGMIWRGRKTLDRLTWPRPELLLALAFLLLPLVTGLAAIMSTGIFSPRYALASTIGVSVLGGWLLPAWNRKFAYGIAVVLTLTLLRNEGTAVVRKLSALASGHTPAQSEARQWAPLFREMESGSAVVIADGVLYLEIVNYASPKYRDSLFYLQDLESAVRFSGTDTIDRALLKLQSYKELHLQLAPDFLRAKREFLMLSTGRSVEWLPLYLRQKNALIRTVGMIGASENAVPSTLSSVEIP